MAGPHLRSPRQPPRASSSRPLGDREIDELQALLDRVPAPFDPLDVSMLDGYLCGVLLQPRAVPSARWLRHIIDVDARAAPPGFETARLHALAQRRHAELGDAIARRQWFDPWVFELAAVEAAEPEALEPGAIDAVYPWVAGFATALTLFPELMESHAQVLTEPLALVYRHLAPDDLEDADELLAEIDSLEPPADLAEAVEGLVRACLLIADVARPLARGPARRA